MSVESKVKEALGIPENKRPERKSNILGFSQAEIAAKNAKTTADAQLTAALAKMVVGMESETTTKSQAANNTTGYIIGGFVALGIVGTIIYIVVKK